MKLSKFPLLEGLLSHYNSHPHSFHVPGHKYGAALIHTASFLEKMTLDDTEVNTAAERTDFADKRANAAVVDAFHWLSDMMRLDVTELSTTDDLHHPEGIIHEAQQLAAACFGADETFFLTGGSTAGNMALIMAACNPGDLILVQRNVHKSVINGLTLAGARAVFMPSSRHEESGLYTLPSLDTVEQALRLYPEAKAVFLTNPNYYGLSMPLTRYAEVIHRDNRLLLVDEAHGAHYSMHPDFPESALRSGVDGVVQSTHKTLTAMTMGAMLHAQGPRINREALRNALAMIQSSSPSYPIMASLDITRGILDTIGSAWFEPGLAAASELRRWLKDEESIFSALEVEDPLRIVIYDITSTLSGYELLRRLEEHNCWAEMADNRYVVLLIGASAEITDMVTIKRALQQISDSIGNDALIELKEIKEIKEFAKSATAKRSARVKQTISDPVDFDRRLLSEEEMRIVSVSQAAGFRSADTIIPYPPGIPLLYKGELITNEIIEEMASLAKDGAKCQGAFDPSLRTIRILTR